MYRRSRLPTPEIGQPSPSARALRSAHGCRFEPRVAMRVSAAAQPASSGCPGRSRSITSGAWSEGIGLPFRASRSISAQTARATRRRRPADGRSACRSSCESRRPDSPTRCIGRARGGAAGRRPPAPSGTAARTPPAPAARRGFRRDTPRVPHVPVFGRDVEVAAEHERLAGVGSRVEPARQPVEPGELGLVERRTDRRARSARTGTHAHAAAGRRDHPRLGERLVVADFGRPRRPERLAEVRDHVRRGRRGSRSRRRSIGPHRGAPARSRPRGTPRPARRASASLVSCISSTSGRAAPATRAPSRGGP